MSHPAIAGEPAVTLSGTVVDVDGKPVPDAEVYLSDGPAINARMARLSVGQVPFRRQILGRTHSGDAGAFTISLADEIPESYWARTWMVLWVRRSGSALTTYLVGRDWPALAAPVKVPLADAPSLPIVVVAPHGVPLPRVRVLPEKVNGVRLPREVAERLASRSDDAGRAVLRGIAPASLDLVRIETEQYGVQWVSLPAAESDGARRIVLAPVGAVRGRLIADDPRAIATVPIRLAGWLAPGDDTAGGGLAEAVTDAFGRFEVPAIVAGALSVRVDPHAELAFRCQPVTARPVAEAITNELTINLERAVRVEGVVRDRDSGEPLAGAAVRVDRQSPRGLPHTNEQGRYTSFLLPGQASPSPWGIPRHYYFPAYTLDTQPVPAGAERVELKPLLLARGATLRGHVVDHAGRGIAGAEIEAHWELASGGENSVHAWSNREGGFTLDGVDPQAQLKLSAASPQGTTAEPVSVAAGAEKPVVVVIAPSHALQLEGRVLNSEKRPVACATVQIARQRRGADGSTGDHGYVRFEGCQRLFTDADGRFRTPAMLVPGLEYRAEVAAGGMLPAMTEFIDPVSWSAGNLGDIVLHDVPVVRTLAGRLLDRRRKPVAGLRVFQTGDGPRRTETITDEHGRFRLAELYTGTVFVLVHGGDYPLQGFLIEDAGTAAELTVRRKDEPVERRLKTLAEPLAKSARREIALRLIEPLLPALNEGELEPEKISVLSTLATLDSNRAAEFAGLPIFNQRGLSLGAETDFQAALALIPEDEAEALALGEAIGEPHYRGRLYLAVCDRLPDNERERKMELLATALLHARSEPDVAQSVELIGQIAERWLDLRQLQRGTALLREAEKQAEQLPAPSEAAARAHELAPHLRAYFAGSLARIDGPAAIKLSAGFTDQFADRYRTVVARGLAGHDPAAAERMLDELEFSAARFPQALPVLHRMAAADAHRAARLARKCDSDVERGYALGIVAHGAAPHNAAQAAAMLDEAYGFLERASADGAGAAYAWDHPAVLAAALLPVAERIDPALIDDCFWRAMALRSPRAARLGADHHFALVTGALATFISRYDRDAARVLAEPIAAHIQSLATDGEYWISKLAWGSLAAVDAAWAESLSETLPDPPPRALRAAKNIARRNIADALAPSADSWWHKLYQLSALRDPDARDYER